METRKLGDTGLTVSSLGLGLAALGRPGYINLGHGNDLGGSYDVGVMEARAHAVLDAAWKAGIRYFDAARSYGRAEAFLSSWLSSRAVAPTAVTVGSKWGYTYTAEWKIEADRHEVKDHSLATLTRQQEESKNLLGAYLHLYQIHSATLDSGVLDNRDVHAALARLRGQGIRIGLSLSGLQQGETLKRAMDIEVEGERLFDCVQATWNLLERSAEASLQEAHHRGMGVVIKEALANGRLTSSNTNPTFAPQRRLLEQVAAEQGVPIDALALAGVLARPWVDVVLSGAARVDHLHANLSATEVTWTEETDHRLRPLLESPEAYWTARGGLAWN